MNEIFQKQPDTIPEWSILKRDANISLVLIEKGFICKNCNQRKRYLIPEDFPTPKYCDECFEIMLNLDAMLIKGESRFGT
jgi:hypothetical protein